MNRDLFIGWKDQYRRMLRWRDRALVAYKNQDDAETVYDFTYAFFQNCYHLRDWMEEDGAASEKDLTELFKNSNELKLCRDICNSSKHLMYKYPSIDSAPRIGREWDPFGKDWHGWYLYSDKRRPIEELIEECVNSWDTFLQAHQIE